MIYVITFQEQVIKQITKQIIDLEKFIKLLQGTETSPPPFLLFKVYVSKTYLRNTFCCPLMVCMSYYQSNGAYIIVSQLMLIFIANYIAQ